MKGNVLVTGGSRGIGRAIAIRLARDGWTPLIHYRKEKSAAEEVALQTGGKAVPFGADLSRKEECKTLWDWVKAQGEIAALVNNAGIYIPQPFDIEEEAEFDKVWESSFATNFWSAVYLSRWFVSQAARGAKILNVCSRVGFRGEAGAAAYAATKGALINLTRSLAVEFAPKGIYVFGIAPGWVETAMTREGMEKRRREIEAGIPFGRVATPDECATVASFLLSEEANYLTGVVIDVNGASYFH